MSNTFKVGEKAIVLKSRHFPDAVGRVVTITEPLQLVRNNEGESWYGYPSDYESNGVRFCPRPHYLKKLSDSDGLRASDSTKLGSWDKVGWSPLKQPERTS